MISSHIVRCQLLKFVVVLRFFFSEYIKMACSFEYWSFEILVLFAGLMPESQLSTSIIAMW